MLATLLESHGRAPRRRSAMFVSGIAHSALILVLVMTKARGNTRPPASDAVPKRPVYVATDKRVVKRSSPSRSQGSNSRFAPPVVGITLPVIEAIGPSVGPIGMHPGREFHFHPLIRFLPATEPMTALTVDQPVELIPGQRPPPYPTSLQSAGIHGDVTVQFVVDTMGRVEQASVRVESSTHVEFARAVQERLKDLRYLPARSGGRVVRQLVEQRFHFEVVRR